MFRRGAGRDTPQELESETALAFGDLGRRGRGGRAAPARARGGRRQTRPHPGLEVVDLLERGTVRQVAVRLELDAGVAEVALDRLGRPAAPLVADQRVGVAVGDEKGGVPVGAVGLLDEFGNLVAQEEVA